jgi:hypothetical protein
MEFIVGKKAAFRVRLIYSCPASAEYRGYQVHLVRAEGYPNLNLISEGLLVGAVS